MIFLTLVSSILLYQVVVGGPCLTRMAEYTPESNVVEHSEIDLDLSEIDDLLDTALFTAANDIYSNGKNSIKGGGLRKLRAFSLEAQALMTGQPFYEMYKAYWNSPTYADDFVQKAVAGTGEFTGLANIARAEGMIKGIQYQVVWMYVIRELEDAVDDCRASNQTNNFDGVKAVDEAWAFYSGSLEGKNGTGSGALLYALAHKRCKQFGVCDADKKAIINKQIVALFAQMQTLLRLGQCTEAEKVIPEIVSYMTVPLIQGALRYVHRGRVGDGWSGTTTNYIKERAEGWAFAAALLPQVHACSPSIATQLKNDMIVNADPYIASGASNLVGKLQSIYPCLKVSCAQVGTMREDDNRVIFPQCLGSESAGFFAQLNTFVLIVSFLVAFFMM